MKTTFFFKLLVK